MTSCQVALDILAISAARTTPALLTRPWIAPHFSTPLATVDSANAGSATLPDAVMIRSGCSAVSDWRPSAFRSTATTLPPSSTTSVLIARPIPCAAPVTMMLLPFSDMDTVIRSILSEPCRGRRRGDMLDDRYQHGGGCAIGGATLPLCVRCQRLTRLTGPIDERRAPGGRKGVGEGKRWTVRLEK